MAQNFVINGGKELHGEIIVNTSKNATVSILMASLVNRGKTILRGVPRIEEAHRIIEVLRSLDVQIDWINDNRDVEIQPPENLNWQNLDAEAARKTRSVIMLMGSFLHYFNEFKIPFAGGSI